MKTFILASWLLTLSLYFRIQQKKIFRKLAPEKGHLATLLKASVGSIFVLQLASLNVPGKGSVEVLLPAALRLNIRLHIAAQVHGALNHDNENTAQENRRSIRN